MAMESPTVPRTRLDQWQNRSRPNAGTTLGYSRFVRIMKVMLPLVACSLIVLVVVYSSGGGREAGKVAFGTTNITDVSNDRQLVSPKLTGTDGRGQPFTVTAKGATQAPGKARRMTIDEVTADITMQDKSWVQVGAIKGELDVEGKTLDLVNSINIYSDQGYECHTEAARYDFGSGLLKGDSPIKCQGPMGLFTAQKFEGLRDPRVLRFMGGVQTTYVPAARTGEAATAAETNPEGIAEPLPDEAAYIPPPAPSSTAPQSPQAVIQPKAKPSP
ncbi:MAG: LPS export ABC transporter periplasmic protein LptC [Alphaproteobacteria bacterium]|jgi:lipopolysaccharide export system protein LptC|nr:LPS export ABC transporter periplasmic protein LptC [Alphaproteobacteria bacterium]